MKTLTDVPKMHAFLKTHYKRERFEGRNDGYCPNYSTKVAISRLEDLQNYGYLCISRHESVTGCFVLFNKEGAVITWAKAQLAT